LTAIALYLCWLLARPFLAAITWALALALVAYPLQYRFERWLRPNLASLLTILAIMVVLLAPGTFLLQRILDEAGGGFGPMAGILNFTRLHEAADRYPRIANILHWLEPRFDLNQELRRAAGTLSGSATEELASLYSKLEWLILPMYYGRPSAYAEVMRCSIALNGSFFNTHRMVSQYVANAYGSTG
jgi:predicted PurR-regulated permease PerM